jgi:hypothetical protein
MTVAFSAGDAGGRTGHSRSSSGCSRRFRSSPSSSWAGLFGPGLLVSFGGTERDLLPVVVKTGGTVDRGQLPDRQARTRGPTAPFAMADSADHCGSERCRRRSPRPSEKVSGLVCRDTRTAFSSLQGQSSERLGPPWYPPQKDAARRRAAGPPPPPPPPPHLHPPPPARGPSEPPGRTPPSTRNARRPLRPHRDAPSRTPGRKPSTDDRAPSPPPDPAATSFPERPARSLLARRGGTSGGRSRAEAAALTGGFGLLVTGPRVIT